MEADGGVQTGGDVINEQESRIDKMDEHTKGVKMQIE